MIGRLCAAAGYGSKFSIAQSFRDGCFHLNTAPEYASRRTFAQVIDRVTDGLLWMGFARFGSENPENQGQLYFRQLTLSDVTTLLTLFIRSGRKKER
jgi:hypothetical protein